MAVLWVSACTLLKLSQDSHGYFSECVDVLSLRIMQSTLRATNWNICAAVDELILIHRDTEGPQDTTISDDRRLTQLESLAEAGKQTRLLSEPYFSSRVGWVG